MCLSRKLRFAAPRLALVAVAGGFLLVGLAGARGGTPPPIRLVPVPSARSLMLRVGLEKIVDLKTTAVPLSYVFESGDRFRVMLTTNHAGYIAVLDRGAAGKLRRLWPATGSAASIAADETVVVPPAGSVRFDETAGTEMIRVVFTLAPLADPTALPLDTATGARGTAGTMSQIRLRGVEADPTANPSDVASYYTGEIVERGIFVADLTLAHRARR